LASSRGQLSHFLQQRDFPHRRAFLGHHAAARSSLANKEKIDDQIITNATRAGRTRPNLALQCAISSFCAGAKCVAMMPATALSVAMAEVALGSVSIIDAARNAKRRAIGTACKLFSCNVGSGGGAEFQKPGAYDHERPPSEVSHERHAINDVRLWHLADMTITFSINGSASSKRSILIKTTTNKLRPEHLMRQF
jgi:hypothetical protein